MGKSPRSGAGAGAVDGSVDCLGEDGALGNNHNVSSTIG